MDDILYCSVSPGSSSTGRKQAAVLTFSLRSSAVRDTPHVCLLIIRPLYLICRQLRWFSASSLALPNGQGFRD